ncbi:MAG: immunoglobulin-like domain-containing protein [Bacteroidia bacterium]
MLLFAFSLLFTQTIHAQISGTKTVCATGCDYNTISKAVADLKANGINGKTTVEINSGQYNESISITGISGLSSSNTLTFKGMGSANTDTRIYNTSTYVIELNNISYVTLDNLHIDQTNASQYYYGIDVNTVKNCTVKNCFVTTYAGPTYYYDLVPMRVRYSTDNMFENNWFRGGYNCVGEGGWTSGCARNTYKKNLLTKFYQYAAVSYYSDANLYIENVVDSGSQTNAYYWYSYGETNAKFQRNYFGSVNTYYTIIYPGAGTFEFSNNTMLNGSGTYIGVYLYTLSSSATINVWHNTVHATSSNTYAPFYLSNQAKAQVDFRNNNITRASSGYTLVHYMATPNDVFQGNNFYNTSGNLMYYNGVTRANLAAYKSAVLAMTGTGQSDQSVPVKYKSSTDLHVDQSSAVPFGKNIGIKTDFDGDSRCDLFVTSGADESNYTGSAHYTKPSAPKFTGPDTVYIGNPSIFLNSANINDPAFYKWYVDGKFVSDSFHLETTAFTSTGNKVKLVAINCGGKDSTEKTVTVMTPTKVPTADFIGDITTIKQDNTVKFTDVSTNYPSSWKWEITPEYTFIDGVNTPNFTVVYGSLTKPNPHIRFNLPGNYKICLTASNVKGTSAAECKTDYIEVIGAVNMSSNATVTASRGYIYDNGGPGNNYSGSYNSRNKLLIDACADSVFLVFTKFDLQCGADFINVYEGKDNTGTNLFSKCSRQTYIGYGSTGGPGSTFCYYGTMPGCFPVKTDTLKAKGTMFIEMGIYGYTPMPGFEAYYWTTPSKEKAPVANFLTADSVCVNAKHTFANTSTGTNIKYYWDLDGSLPDFESTVKNPEWTYYMSGPVTVTLITENCGGRDTFSKTINVFNPPVPKAAFSADNTNPTISDIVFFSPEVKECVDMYRWKFTPVSGIGQAVFMNGTKNSSANPQVNFTDTGCYNATLFVANATGDDSITLSCYLYVKNPYCIPAVNALTADIGISKVSFHTISNASAQSTSAYNNYLPQLQHSAKMEEGVTYTLTVERKTNKNKAARTVWIDWNLDGDFNDTLEQVAHETSSTNLSWSTNIKMPSFAQYGASVMRIGIDLGSQTASPCGKNQTGEFEDYRVYLRAYETKPVIKLLGNDTVFMQRGYVYKDSGAVATSLRFGDISTSIVTTMPLPGFNQFKGTYYISYNVSDSLGNKAYPATRVIIIVSDTTPPEVIVEKPDTVMVQVNNTFAAPAILKAYDIADSTKLTIHVDNNVDITKIGEYDVIYTVTDRSGNATIVIRHVIVIDTILPLLKLYGIDTVLHQVGYMYSDLGVSVKDNYFTEAELRNNLTIQNNVDAFVVGDYTVVYTLTDPYTRTKLSVTRTVLVRDTEKPAIKLAGDTVTLDVFTTFYEPGITVSDNYDKAPVVSKQGSFYQDFSNGKATKLGIFEIIYVVTDASGNSTSASRVVIVVDRIKPILMLKGDQAVNVCRWSIYTDAGYEVSDNYNSAAELTIEMEGSMVTEGTKREGIYSLVYKATDKSGNVGYSTYRYIYVRSPYEFPCSTTTGIAADIAIGKLINIYPNPNSGKFTVEANLPTTDQVRITVTNLLGQEVAVMSNDALNTNTFQVDLSNQKAGVYMLNIRTANQSVTKCIVVTK